jgi:phosphotriesterase-related protein
VHPEEEKSLAGAALAAARTGMSITVHPGRNPQAPITAVRIAEKAGADLSRLVIGHLDRTLFSIKEMIELAETGCVLEFDLFGLESCYYPLTPIDMPNDAKRVDYIVELFEAGFGTQVAVGQDCDTKTRLTQYGGEGYQHIIERVVPIMRRKGLSEADVDQILIGTPQRLLTLA